MKKKKKKKTLSPEDNLRKYLQLDIKNEDL